MKDILKYSVRLIIACTMISYVGCADDKLTLYPEDKLSPETYFSNEEELELWTNRFYNQLESANSESGVCADDVTAVRLGSILMGERSPASEDGWTWGMLRNINYYLQHSGNCKDFSAKQHYDGIAYFMRAYFYFEKVKRYGDVPWYGHVLNSNDELLFKPRDNRALVVDSILNDLDKAINMLRTTKSISRVTKWTALALKSRIALFEGTFRKYHGIGDYEKYLTQASEASAEFISNSGYSLFTTGDDPYRTLFNSDKAIEQEIILARVYNQSLNIMHSVPFNISNTQQGLTKRFMNHYLMADATKFTDIAGWETLQYTEETIGRDPRMAQTVLLPGYVQKGEKEVTVNSLVSITGYQPIKFVAEKKYDGNNKGVSDWPLFRTAEVYLNFAEAKAELGTLTQSDLDISINKIRARAKMPDLKLATANSTIDPYLLSCYPNVSTGTNQGVILEIRRERTIELVMEGFRIWDIFRWKEGKQLTNKIYGCYFPGEGKYDMDLDGITDLQLWIKNKDTSFNGIYKKIGEDITLSNSSSGYIWASAPIIITWDEGRDYLWPIPASERVLTGGVLTQNPGYEDGTGYN
mgnify:CR=1 FL=1